MDFQHFIWFYWAGQSSFCIFLTNYLFCFYKIPEDQLLFEHEWAILLVELHSLSWLSFPSIAIDSPLPKLFLWDKELDHYLCPSTLSVNLRFLNFAMTIIFLWHFSKTPMWKVSHKIQWDTLWQGSFHYLCFSSVLLSSKRKL